MRHSSETRGPSSGQMADTRRRRRTRSSERRYREHVGKAFLSVVVAVAAASVPFQAINASSASAATPGADWPGYLYSPGHSSYNAAATTITPANASALGPAWNWLVPASTHGGRTALFASPTVSNGVVYIGAEDGDFYAISETTHQRLWSKFLGVLVEPPGECGGYTAGIISTATVANDPNTGLPTVYVFGPDGYLYALDAVTGATVWRGHVDTPAPGTNDYYSWSSPLVVNGKVYVGIAANCGNPTVPGGVSSFDQVTGNHIAHWASVAPGQVGATVWSSPGVGADGSILVTTGNSCGQCSSTPLYNESIVKLDPSTLSLKDFWQIPISQQNPDGDFGASPTSFTATLNGVATPMVGACNKGTGDFYALKQNDLSAGPVWEVNMTIPYTANGANEQCDGAAIWNGTSLIVPGGAPTTLNGVTYTGSMQAFDPATGTPLWRTGLAGAPVGSPTEDGSGVIAAQVFRSDTGFPGVYLMDASNGSVLSYLQAPKLSPLFGQAVFVGGDLLVGGGPGMGLTDYHLTRQPTVTSVTPSVIATGQTRRIMVSGTGFLAGAKLKVSNGTTVLVVKNVNAQSTTITANVNVPAGAATGQYAVTVTNSDGGSATCTTCLSVVPAPTLTSLSPASVAPGTVTPVVLTGTGFVEGVGLRITGPTGVAFSKVKVTSTSITATMTVAPGAVPASNLPISVTNGSAGGNGKATADILSIVP